MYFIKKEFHNNPKYPCFIKISLRELMELTNINGFKNMLRWARITRMKKVSILRLNFNGTIGTLDGQDMNTIADKICLEFGNNINKFS